MGTFTTDKKETQPSTPEVSLYEQDFYQWIFHNAELLKQRRFEELDLENLIEELESMGRNNKKELISRLVVLITHLLKFQYQPEKQIDSNSWIRTVNTQRRDIGLLIENSPSLKHNIELSIDKAYKRTITEFEKETKISKKTLPDNCPYTFEQIMDDDFLPSEK